MADNKRYTTLKVRLYPNEAQADLFEKPFGCRYIWNQMLADQERFYLETGKFFIPTPAKYKAGAPFLKEVDNQALIQEHNRLNQAFRLFFKHPENFGYPKFKRKKEDRDSFTACNHDFPSGPTIYTTKDGIRMTKAGIVRAKFHRRPQAWWKLRRITVDKTRTGKYYACILYECPAAEREPVPPTPEKTVGLKYSIPHFYVTDGGETADPPHWVKRSQEKLANIQRSLGRMQPGSKRYRETVQKLRLTHEHIANQRRDFIHKESRQFLLLAEKEPNTEPSRFGFLMTVRSNSSVSRGALVAHLEEHNIQTCPLFAGNLIRHPCFQTMKEGTDYRVIGDLQATNRTMNQSFWVGVYPGMEQAMLDEIVGRAQEAFDL